MPYIYSLLSWLPFPVAVALAEQFNQQASLTYNGVFTFLTWGVLILAGLLSGLLAMAARRQPPSAGLWALHLILAAASLVLCWLMLGFQYAALLLLVCGWELAEMISALLRRKKSV